MAQFVLGSRDDFKAGDGGGSDREFPVIPEYTQLICEVMKVEEREKKEEFRFDEDDLTEISYRFKVIDGEYAKRQMFGTTSPWFNWNPKCKFRHWVEAILGVEKDGLPDNFELDLPALTGMKCRVIAGVKKRKKDQSEYNIVLDVLPLPSTQTAQQVFGS